MQKPTSAKALTLRTCLDCGGAVTSPRHVRYDACIAVDPAQTPEVRGPRAPLSMLASVRCPSGDKANPGAVYDPELFRRDILPKLAGVNLSEIVEAIACSKASASDIRGGKRVPNLSSWPALGELVEVKNLVRRSGCR